jgi:hypothetical protein
MRAAILGLALLLAACTANSPGVPHSADTNPETGTHGGGNVD